MTRPYKYPALTPLPSPSFEEELNEFLKSVERRAFKRAVYAVRDEDAALEHIAERVGVVGREERGAEHPIADAGIERVLAVELVAAVDFLAPLLVFLGMLCASDKVDIPGAHLIGVLLVAVGLVDFFVMPRVLVNRWKTPEA